HQPVDVGGFESDVSQLGDTNRRFGGGGCAHQTTPTRTSGRGRRLRPAVPTPSPLPVRACSRRCTLRVHTLFRRVKTSPEVGSSTSVRWRATSRSGNAG